MTNQEAFTKMVTHLRKQQARALRGPSGPCQYKAYDGRMCAVGCLIPDSEYKPYFENKCASSIKLLVPSLKGVDVALLESMQDLHDCVSVEAWEAGYKEVSKKFNLEVPK